MPTNKSHIIEHGFTGGWATDFGNIVRNSPNASGGLDIPYLIQARNVEFDLNGALRKCGGTASYIPNNAQIFPTVASPITGLFEWWHTVGETSRRKVFANLILNEGTVSAFGTIYSDFEGNGQFAAEGPPALNTTSSGVCPHFSTFDDLLFIGVYGDPSTYPSIAYWDGNTYKQESTISQRELPRFSFATQHSNRMFAAGVLSDPSRLYYSKHLDPVNWVDIDAGAIDINPGDGDEITGITSWNTELIIFKGPRFGSIWRLNTAGAPTDWTLNLLSGSGVTAAWQRSIFQFGNDVGFVSPRGTVHSLVTTDRYGDMETGYLSLPINHWLKHNTNLTQRRFWQAVTLESESKVYITLSRAGSADNDIILVMDYRFMAMGEGHPRWTYLDYVDAQSMCITHEYGNIQRVLVGDRSGRLWKLGYHTGLHNGTAITATVETPHLSYGSLAHEKTLDLVGALVEPIDESPLTIGWSRDGVLEQTSTVTQGATHGYGTFTLGTTQLGNSPALPRFCEAEHGGQFRSIRYRVTNDTSGSLMTLHGIVSQVTDSGLSTENTDGN